MKKKPWQGIDHTLPFDEQLKQMQRNIDRRKKQGPKTVTAEDKPRILLKWLYEADPKVKACWLALLLLGRGLTVKETAEITGLSKPVVRKSLDLLENLY